MMTPDFSNDTRLSLDTSGVAYLKEAAKWARFLAIVGFVMMGLLLLAGLLMMVGMNSMLSELGSTSPLGGAFGIVMGLMYIVIAALYLYPLINLYRFANSARAAIASGNSALLNQSMGNLKSMFKFIGVLTAIVLGFYALIFLLTIVGGGLGAMMSR